MEDKLDPTSLHVETNLPPTWANDESFQELMAAQLRHAPWFVLSVLIHGVLVLAFLLLPSTKQKKQTVALQMAMPEKVEEIDIPEPVEEVIQDEVPPEEPVLQDTEVSEPTDNVAAADTSFESPPSAFDSTSINTAIGVGGGAAGKFGNRSGGRGILAKRGGQTADAIYFGLEWLKAHQDEDGKWDADEFMKHDSQGQPTDGDGDPLVDVGVTGLALLAFLGDGSTMYEGDYADVVNRGIRWLRKQQDRETGLVGTTHFGQYIYNHAIATYALVEAYGLSHSKALRRHAQRAIDYLEEHRNPAGVWRYQPQDNDNDTSVTGWCVMAYASALEFELEVNLDAFTYAETWFAEQTDSIGRTGYASGNKGGRPSREGDSHEQAFPAARSECLTAVALLCRLFMDQDPNDSPIMIQQADLIAARPPKWDDEGSIDHYYWHYASYAMFQMGTIDGKNYWKLWSKALQPNVVAKQRKQGNFKGSWDPIGAWGSHGGRVYSTATLVLTLEAFYRYTALLIR